MKVFNFDEEISSQTTEEYSRLLGEYERLNEEQKQAIILYKSVVFVFMRQIMNVQGYEHLTIDEIFGQLKNSSAYDELLNDQKAIFEIKNIAKNMSEIPLGGFLKKSLSLYQGESQNHDDSLKQLLNDLIPYCKTLSQAFQSLTLNEDMEVYRGTVDVDDKNELTNSKIVSTSLAKDVACNFLHSPIFENELNLGRIYKLKVKKGTHVLVCPIGFEKGMQIKSNQLEVLFEADETNFYIGNEERQKTMYSLGGIPFTVDYCEGVVFPKDMSFYTEEEIMQDMVQVNPSITAEELLNQINGFYESEEVGQKII